MLVAPASRWTLMAKLRIKEAAMGLHVRQVREELRGLGMDIQADKTEKK